MARHSLAIFYYSQEQANNYKSKDILKKKKSLTKLLSVLVKKSVLNFNDSYIGKYLQQSFVDQISSSSSQHNIN